MENVTEYVGVYTRRPSEVPAYLYAGSKVIVEAKPGLFPDSSLIVVEVTGKPGSAQYQADRLSSGNHGARVCKTLDEIHQWEREFGW